MGENWDGLLIGQTLIFMRTFYFNCINYTKFIRKGYKTPINTDGNSSNSLLRWPIKTIAVRQISTPNEEKIQNKPKKGKEGKEKEQISAEVRATNSYQYKNNLHNKQTSTYQKIFRCRKFRRKNIISIVIIITWDSFYFYFISSELG